MALVGDGATRADRQPVSLNVGLNRGVRATAKEKPHRRCLVALPPERDSDHAVPTRRGVSGARPSNVFCVGLTRSSVPRLSAPDASAAGERRPQATPFTDL